MKLENTYLQLLDPEYDDTIILQNVGNYGITPLEGLHLHPMKLSTSMSSI